MILIKFTDMRECTECETEFDKKTPSFMAQLSVLCLIYNPYNSHFLTQFPPVRSCAYSPKLISLAGVTVPMNFPRKTLTFRIDMRRVLLAT